MKLTFTALLSHKTDFSSYQKLLKTLALLEAQKMQATKVKVHEIPQF